MDDNDQYVMQDYEGDVRWWSPSSVLTSGTSAITAFTLAVVGTMGFVGYPVAEALIGFPDGPGEMRERAVLSGMVVLLLLIGALWLSQRVLVDDEEEEEEETPGWARHMAGSSVVLAAIGVVLSIVTISASLLHNSDLATHGPFVA